MSAKDIRWEVVFVAETDEVEQKALDNVMGILYDFGVRKGLFVSTESTKPDQQELPDVSIQQSSFIPSQFSHVHT